MNLKQLLCRQWDGYRHTHQSRINLAIHVLTVPVFVLGIVLAGYAVVTLSLRLLAAGLIANALAIGLQGLGHRLERVAPPPFAGIGNAVVRIVCEQCVTFPRFLLTGSWRG